MKRFFSLALCLALLLCSAAPLAFAAETEVTENTDSDASALVDVSGCGFTATTSVATGSTMARLCESSPENLMSLLRGLGVYSSVLICSCTDSYLYGYYFDAQGILRSITCSNPLGVANASLLGVYALSELEVLNYGSYVYTKTYGTSGWQTYEYPVFYDSSYAEIYPDFLTSNLYVIDWSSTPSVSTIGSSQYVWLPLFTKSSANTVIGTTMSRRITFSPDTGYRVGAFTWDSGGGSVGDDTSGPFIYVSSPASVARGLYILPWAKVENATDVSGDIICILSGQQSNDTKLTASDSLANTWTLDCSRMESADQLTLTFYVDGSPDIATTFLVDVTGTSSGQGSSGSGNNTEATEPEPTYSGSENADDFNTSVNDQKDDFDDAMDVLEDYTRPNYEDVDPGFDDILDGDAITKAREALAAIFDNTYIKQVFFIAFMLAAVSFIIFGKR